MKHKCKQSERGFVALISILIIALILILVAYGVSTSGFLVSGSAAEFYDSELSFTLAYSCFDRAVFEINENLDYTGDETFTVDDYQCTIEPIVQQSTSVLIYSNATVNRVTTRLEGTLDEFLIVTLLREL